MAFLDFLVVLKDSHVRFVATLAPRLPEHRSKGRDEVCRHRLARAERFVRACESRPQLDAVEPRRQAVIQELLPRMHDALLPMHFVSWPE